MYNESSGEITVCFDVEYRAVTYSQLPILRLLVEEDFGISLDDEYSDIIPCLKMIPDFRKFLIQFLTTIMQAPSQLDPLLNRAIPIYVEILQNYDDIAIEELIQQAKTSVQSLGPLDPAAEAKARQILTAMNQIPGCDVRIEFEG